MPGTDLRRPTLDDARGRGGPLMWVVLPFVATYLFGRWLVRATIQLVSRGLRDALEAARRLAGTINTSARALLATVLRSWRRFAAAIRAVTSALWAEVKALLAVLRAG